VNGERGGRPVNSAGDLFGVARWAREVEFEHWLDESDQLGAACERQYAKLWHRVGDREVRQVDRDNVERLGDPARSEIGKVRALKVGDAGILAKGSEELAVSRVERGSPSALGRTRCDTRSSPPRWTPEFLCATSKKPLATLTRARRCATTEDANP